MYSGFRILTLFFLLSQISLYAQSEFSTYFTYSDQELSEVKSLTRSIRPITINEITKWDDLTYNLTSNARLPDIGGARFFSYLYVAQRDFAFLSQRMHNEFLGTIDSITIKVINLFFPDYQPKQPIREDGYSHYLANVVFKKIQERYENEEKDLKLYPPKIGPEYWKETEPVIGQKAGSCQTWLVGPIEKLRLPEPPPYNSLIWTYGIHEIEQSREHLTEEQKKQIEYWANMLGPKSGNWMAIANDYISELKPPKPLKDFLIFRSVYAMGSVDTMISCFDTKYTYWVIRPNMKDPQLKILIPVPKHPSYPAGHSVAAASAATLLSHFFPEKTSYWRTLAIESGNSRVRAGLHYMYDNEQGFVLGERVANAAIESLKK